MKVFNAAHLEVKKDFKEDFQTNPFEAGWASECIFFVMVEDLSGEAPELTAEVEISHDGMSWAKEGSALTSVNKKGLHFVKVHHFGNWLRLNCHIEGEKPSFRLNIQIALKE
ncbi:hypothetical protein [Rhodohalobacter sp. 614A]|uniref:hypothetical protein n=1 Tax=Rhodohalobacter sp. 614A TaxID=2908649 RepID=UPI001F23AF74|nr:hypothetical protein [Rhodohalobacter sp. 614A]